MLQLVQIKKNYLIKDQDPVRALRGVSLNFRKNEFVAILGPSGCGKTTLLNIIGGLDRYTEGDLIIKDKSTKNYKDRDWDTYRNHSIGFVFQAYNLIGHQSVLKNVELALTIGGVARKERKERAMQALEKVGLKGMERKKPNQLSGGQMQRVAIARALVNNPEILLADEPTGALDSETSVQIMDLLKEVAKDRLVIMVTHNPDLAEKYATRIVNMFDGVITGDTNPFDGAEKEKRQAFRCPKCGAIVYDKEERCPKCGALAKYPEVKKEDEEETKKKAKSSMSFFTATSLSLANLFSKSKRTILVAIAGSIGIFGVSTVLAASTGVRHFIDTMQDDMLSSYPLSIAEEAVDYTSLMTGLYNDSDTKIADFDITNSVGLNSMIDYLMDKYADITSVKTNVINEDLVQFVKEIPGEYLSATSFDYAIDPTNNIFTSWDATIGQETNGDPIRKPVDISLNGLTQRYIAELTTVEGFGQYATYVDLFTDFMKLLPDGLNDDGVFDEKDYAYIRSQYDLLGDSKFPQNENEIMLVVGSDTTLTDLVFAQLGYYHEEDVMNIAKKAIRKYAEDRTEEETDEYLDKKFPYATSFSYTDLLNKKFTYYPHDTIYKYDELADSAYNEYNIVLKTAANDEFYVLNYSDNTSSALLKGAVYTGTYINLNTNKTDSVYMIKMKDGFSVPSLMSGGDITDWIADPEKDLPFVANEGVFLCVSSKAVRSMIAGSTDFDLSAISEITINSGDETTAEVKKYHIELSPMPPHLVDETVTFSCKKDVTNLAAISAYQYPAVAEPTWTNGVEIRISGILRPKKNVSFGCLSRGVYFTKEFQQKYMNDAKNSQIIKGDNSFTKHIEAGGLKTSMYNAYVTYEYPNWEDYNNPDYHATGYKSCLNGDLSSSFSSLFSSITGVDYESENNTHFRSLCGLKINAHEGATPEELTYTYDELPEKMSIYPIDFARKNKVNNYLDQWNKDVEITLYDGTAQEKTLKLSDRDELTYTDTISLIVTVIDTMITIITTALVIFTSLSLVVSSFMIAVITYISVMERVKEIGVIRSLGGRKKDVSRLFIAENLVTGFLSGIIGIGITAVVCIIINLAISPFGVPNIALLTLPIIGIMIALSIVLSVVAGLIPSLHASRQDPVIALRSE
ncbi:MAG: ATP-binding cassette domain-containing protein [Bacilli bacterium]|nr:ATP-binding cassette domain-containing protein [Bacilli bacterium]